MADKQSQKPEITLYWLDKSRSQRIVWLLEECKGLEYNVTVFKRGEDMLAPPELKKVHPLGKSPVIKVQSKAKPDSKPVVLAESGTIVEYLCGYFAKHLVPERFAPGVEEELGCETEEWLRYRFFMHYAEGSFMPYGVLALIVENIKSGPQVPFLARPITRIIGGKIESIFLNPNFTTHFNFLEDQLATSPGGGKYLCGTELTAADILMSFPLIGAQEKMNLDKYPRVKAYIDLITSNEGYVRSTKKIEEISGEPFEPML